MNKYFIVIGQNGIIGNIIKEKAVNFSFDLAFVSLRNDFNLLTPLMQRPFEIIYLSWANRVNNSDSEAGQQENILRSYNLFTLLSKNKNFLRLINIGSYNEYGNIAGDLTEQVTCIPSNSYSKAKLLVNNLGFKILGNKFLNIRLSNLISKFQPKDSLFISLLDCKLKNQTKYFYGSKINRTFITEFELWFYMSKIMRGKNIGIINMSGGHLFSDFDIIELCVSSLNINKNLIQITDKIHKSIMNPSHTLNVNLLKNNFGIYNKTLNDQIKILFEEYRILEN